VTLADSVALRGLGYVDVVSAASVVRLEGDRRRDEEATIAEEVPVAFVYNGRPHAVMLASPADLEDFAVGFTLAEAIVHHADAIESLTIARHSAGIEMQLTIPDDAATRLVERDRRLVGRSGCGLCGVAQVADALRLPEAPIESTLRVTAGALWRAAAALDEGQTVNRATHAVHAAAFAAPDGRIAVLREDVGRHNALDKLIGALARQGSDPRSGFVLVTSRASVELVQKAAVAGIPLLAAVSRPTALAVRVAESVGVALVGLLRGESANVYARKERVLIG